MRKVHFTTSIFLNASLLNQKLLVEHLLIPRSFLIIRAIAIVNKSKLLQQICENMICFLLVTKKNLSFQD